MSELVYNERVKLLASMLDRASTASLTIGVLAPIAASLYAVTASAPGIGTIAIGAAIWLFAAAVLHLGAQIVLGRLRS